MKKLKFGQTISVLANVGVIAGIVFLAIEIRQNNELLAAESRAASSARLVEIPAIVSTDIALTELLVRAKNGETLSEAEEARVIAFSVVRLRGQEAFFNEYRAGAIESIPVEQWRTRFYGELFGAPPQAELWDRTKRYLDVSFVQFMDENVVNR